jgi:hypothetical protein
LKISLKKILFVIVCAEMMILYWAYLEVQQTEQMVYRQGDNPVREMSPSTADTADAIVKKAS